jgi:hypothetical protein
MNPYVANPFRVLGLRSDASSREIARASDRLLKWIEIGETPQVVESLPFLPVVSRDAETVKQALGKIENPRDRIQQELFWPSANNAHFQACFEHLTLGRYKQFVSLCESAIAKFDVREGKGKTEGQTERLDASLCRHFLAIFFHSAALSSSKLDSASPQIADSGIDWHRAFQCWISVYRDDVFWGYVASRVKLLNDPRLIGFDINRLRQELPQRILQVNGSLALAGLEQHKNEIFVTNARLIRKSQFAQSEQDRALKKLTPPLSAQFQKAFSEISQLLTESAARERTSSLRKLPSGGFEGVVDPEKFNEYFTAMKSHIEKKLIPIAELVLRADLADLDDGSELLDNAAYTLRRLSLTVNNVGDMPKKALEITKTAKRFAKSAECTQRLCEDETALQFLILQREAINASESNQFDQAILKLQEAKKYATPEEQKTVDEWIEATRRRAVLGGAKPIGAVPSMFTFNGIGTTLYGRRAYDKNTDTYIATLFFVFFFIPVFPIAAYRVKNVGGNRYQFYGKVPLTKWAFVPLAVVAGLILFAYASDSVSSLSQPTSSNSPRTSTSVESTPNSSSQDVPSISSDKTRLSEWLNSEEVRLKNEESQISTLNAEIERERAYLHTTYVSLGDDPSQEQVDNYKGLQARFNSRVSNYNALLDRHHSSVQRYNTEVQRYNSMQ